MKCIGITKKGENCKLSAKHGQYCWIHVKTKQDQNLEVANIPQEFEGVKEPQEPKFLQHYELPTIRRKLKCNHVQFTVEGENTEFCLECEGKDKDTCPICLVEFVSDQPCLRLSCGHFFHVSCVLNQIKTNGRGVHIALTSLNCCMCKTRITHPALMKRLEPLIQTENAVKALISKEKIDEEYLKSQELQKLHSTILDYALTIYVFYECWKCLKVTFGGKKECQRGEISPQDCICDDCKIGEQKPAKCPR